MDGVADSLLKVAASQIKGARRRIFLAHVCQELCAGNVRLAEKRFGWGRHTIAKGMQERELSPEQLAARKSRHKGKKRSEEQNPQLAIDIRLIVEPHTHTDPELKTERRYTNLSAAEVRQALLDRGYAPEGVPSERTMRDILNRMNYRLKRIQKGKPLKKTKTPTPSSRM
jgi:transposase